MSLSSITQNISYIVLLANLILAIGVIFFERRNVGVTWAWLMVLLFLPVVGFPLYLLFGQNLSRLKMYKIKKETEERFRGIIERQRKQFRQHKLVYNDETAAEYDDLIYMNLSSAMSLYTQDNDVRIFTEGTSKFEALLGELETAKHHIHLMYYIVHDDGIGRKLLDCLARKAAEGVAVRFLYDPVGSHRLHSRFFEPLERAGGEVAAFFPSRIPYLNFRVNYRNHRKMAIIDGKVGYIGGINVGDEYLGLVARYGFWRDTHLRLQGSAVKQMQSQFLLDWNLASGRMFEGDPYFPNFTGDGEVGMQIVSSGPDQEMEQIKNGYIRMIHLAKESVWIQTPYFIPDESLLNAIRLAALSGVDVKIMIPAEPDHKMVYWASRSYLGDLLSLGVHCLLYGKGFLHAKALVIDGKAATVGTANFDIRSFKLNFESNAFIFDRGVAEQLKRTFEEDMAFCRELTEEEHLNRPRLHKIRESVTRLLSPIL
ncbi:cardiolipin synthase [Cohnella algarum]|uniref:cardiolipin synthase n=1 Tax=Cohnella algarum TaxID=2044859 RepID=UPI001966CFC1|nr:cardiolipin synthase [Cohnella algarum]MBN2984547.1 cardiolipin synthase [Cohnella algarum]